MAMFIAAIQANNKKREAAAKATTAMNTTHELTTTIVPTTTTTEEATTTQASQDLASIVGDAWLDLRNVLGLTPKCQNNGVRKKGWRCECPKLFEGDLCENPICLNGGQRTRVSRRIYECKCPTPQYIEGPHCDIVRCANQAPLVTNATGSWLCDCSQTMLYKGQFCERFEIPMAVVVASFLCLLLFAISCNMCQLYVSRWQDDERRRTTSSSRHTARCTARQEVLLAVREDRPLSLASRCARQVRLPALPTPPRAEPTQPSVAPPPHPMEPPPSYAEAIASSAPPKYDENQTTPTNHDRPT